MAFSTISVCVTHLRFSRRSSTQRCSRSPIRASGNSKIFLVRVRSAKVPLQVQYLASFSLELFHILRLENPPQTPYRFNWRFSGSVICYLKARCDCLSHPSYRRWSKAGYQNRLSRTGLHWSGAISKSSEIRDVTTDHSPSRPNLLARRVHQNHIKLI
jgi:hypothetical protein